MAAQPSGELATPPCSVSSANLLRMLSVQASRSLMILSRIICGTVMFVYAQFKESQRSLTSWPVGNLVVQTANVKVLEH